MQAVDPRLCLCLQWRGPGGVDVCSSAATGEGEWVFVSTPPTILCGSSHCQPPQSRYVVAGAGPAVRGSGCG